MRRSRGVKMVLQCNAHIGCPFLQKVDLNRLSRCFERSTAYEHAGDDNEYRRSNSALTFAQEQTLHEGLDMGAKPMEVLVPITKKRKAALQAQGKNPLRHKKPEGGLKGPAFMIQL